MAELLFKIFFGGEIIISFLLLYMAFMFYQEGEKEGAKKAVLLGLLVLFLGTVIFLLHLEITIYITIVILSAAVILLIYPFKKDLNYTDDFPNEKYDERDIMFSRKELIPGTKKYKAYYARNPDKEPLDNLFRKEPGLLSPKSAYYHEEAFRKADESFSKIKPLYQYLEGKVNSRKTILTPLEFTNLIKSRAKELGVLDIGISITKPYHFYSHKGRRDEYGNEINNRHKYAIAFTVEMDHEMVMAAPQASIVAESAKQYLNAGIIATQIAELIRTLGYEARPHIDGNYQVICPLVARDAGLGEIGRMGLLMTPKHGPRVRIGVVSTGLELTPDKYHKNHSVIDFCSMCKKCAVCCPSQSISNEDPKLINGVKRWKIDSESCFTFWCKAGTDCGRCMAVCPYSHTDHPLHKLTRWGIQHSKVFRLMAVRLDDYFYGQKPAPKPLPKKLDK